MTARLFILVLFLLSAFAETIAQPREKITINSGWQFVLNDQASLSASSTGWKNINLPHTWNALDIIDDQPGYHQGIGWYKKQLFIPASYSDKHLELYFEGACNRVDVFINGQKAGDHTGAFTGFRINLDGWIKPGSDNEILVKADNGKYLQDSVPPYSGDFSMMGGIYRDLWLIVTNMQHFQNHFGNEGLLFETTVINDQKAAYKVNTFFTGNNVPLNGSIEYELSYKGNPVQSGKKQLKKFSGHSAFIEGSLAAPELWSPENPELYELRVSLKNEKGELLDELVEHVGFKWVGIGAGQEFLLNGKPYKLRGASRHQDYKNIGNALTDAMHIRDIELMKAMGCNFIRIAHYPQDPAIYNACDRLGLIAWSEIPVVDRVVDNPVFFQNSASMMQEMILQNYDHSCVAIWGYHNEVRNLGEATIRHAKMLDSIAKKLDKARLTAMAFESNIELPYFSNPLLKEILNIADINGYNVYQGWYRGKHETIASFLDTLHAYNPAKPILLSEYGAGSIINMHAYQTTLFDFSEEYQCQFHESYLRAGNTKSWMMGFAIWNFIDFQRDGREDVVPNINKKGMVTTDRQPKDVYYYYKSQWSREPFVYIAGKHWPERYAILSIASEADITQTMTTVYSNQDTVELYCNGRLCQLLSAVNGKFEFAAPLYQGANNFLCKTKDSKLSDQLTVNYIFINKRELFKDGSYDQLNFNTGQSRSFFIDNKTNEQWMPDHPYSQGSWGYIDGAIWNTWPSATWNGLREGIHKAIANTENEPLFQTFVEGLTAWKADLPAGKYRISLLLCEPFTDAQRKNTDRIFSIALNGKNWADSLNIAALADVQSAIILDKEIDLKDKEGLTIDFRAVSGKTILNGVSIRKL